MTVGVSAVLQLATYYAIYKNDYAVLKSYYIVFTTNCCTAAGEPHCVCGGGSLPLDKNFFEKVLTIREKVL